MYKKLIINVADYETRVALLENNTIAEIFVDRPGESDISGNIYKGKVQRVLPGMQAAFIDIGLSQTAFLYVDDIGGQPLLEGDTLFQNHNGDLYDGDPPKSWGENKEWKIEEILAEGQEVLVHVAKSPIGTKGARVTTHVSLPGRFLVLMPKAQHIGVSRRIEDEKERERLKGVIEKNRSDGFGYILRTASEGCSEKKIIQEMEFLTQLWQAILKRYNSQCAPAILHKELDLSLRAVRDLMTFEVEKVVIDSAREYEKVVAFLDRHMPGLKRSVELYDGREPIFDAFNIEVDLARALKRKVWLKSGGYIVIEPTEALVAIDVNTGRYVGQHKLEETILKTNLEAVKEIAYQMRLRDIGGIIIIDFIDMKKKAHQEKVYTALQEALKKDRSRTHILPISELGIIQMTRKRIKKSLNSMLCEPCFYCEGEGTLLSKQSICYRIYREIQKEAVDALGSRFTVRVNPEIADMLHGEENRLLGALEKNTGKPIVVYPDPQFHLEEFDIFDVMME